MNEWEGERENQTVNEWEGERENQTVNEWEGERVIVMNSMYKDNKEQQNNVQRLKC